MIGLQPPLSLDVEIHNPQTLALAMSLARKLEMRDQCVAASTPPPVPSRASSRGILLSPPARLALPQPPAAAPPPPQPPAVTAPANVDGRPVKRLSQAEMEERRRLGLCFNCNEKFGRGHNRVCQCIFLVDLAEADDDDEDVTAAAETTEPLISLHAIAGVRMSETMQVPLQLGTTSFLALLDSGSTHNFILEEAARGCNLRLECQGGLEGHGRQW